MDKTMIQKLRKVTGAGISACVEALKISECDFDKAIQILREKGRIVADEKSMRLANEGVICIIHDSGRKYGVMIELNCETDFVANNDCFVDLASDLALHVLTLTQKHASDPSSMSNEPWNSVEISVNQINDCTLNTYHMSGEQIKLDEKMQQMIVDATMKLGEKICLSKFFVYGITGPGFVTSYLHNKHARSGNVGRLGVLLAISGYEWEQASKDLRDSAHKISMHVAAMQPLAIERDRLEAQLVDQKADEIKRNSDLQDKSQGVIDRILSGKMNKFYQEVVLLEQSFVMDDRKSVRTFWKETRTDEGCHILRFDFLRVGQ